MLDLCLQEDGRLGGCDEGGTWIAAVSFYLYNLNRLWTTGPFAGKPNFWFAAAGTYCDNVIRIIGGSTKGCATGTRNDGVVCQESAAFGFTVNNGPDERWEDVLNHYSHRSGAVLLFCLLNLAFPLPNPEEDPERELLMQLKTWIEGLRL